MAAEQNNANQILNILDDLATQAKKQGVSGFKFSHSSGSERTITVRNGPPPEKIEGSNPEGVTVKVYFGAQGGVAESPSLRPADLRQALSDAIALAQIVSPDPAKLPTNPEDLATEFPDLDLNDPYIPDDATLKKAALAAEEAALAHPKITNSGSVWISHNRSVSTILASNGFRAQNAESSSTLFASMIAGTEKMQSDYAYSQAHWYTDLEDPVAIGRRAAEQTVARLNPIKLKTGKLPVVFDPRVSGSLLRAFAGAIAGDLVFRKSTFLLDKMGQRIFPEGIDIIDNPEIIRGANSGTFNTDGVARHKTTLVKDGILQTWMLSVEDARKLGTRTTGHAPTDQGRTSNLYMTPGLSSPEDLISDIKEGLYVTDFDGGEDNSMTGEYSYGATGFLISNGRITPQAVSGVTIAGSLEKMFRHMARANNFDLAKFKHEDILAPTIRIAEMTLGGS